MLTNVKKFKSISFSVRVYHFSCISFKNLQEILMGCGRSFQQKVSLLSLRKTLREANFGTDKENPLMRQAQGLQLSFFIFSHLHMLRLHLTTLFCGLRDVLCGCTNPFILCLKCENSFPLFKPRQI